MKKSVVIEVDVCDLCHKEGRNGLCKLEITFQPAQGDVTIHHSELCEACYSPVADAVSKLFVLEVVDYLEQDTSPTIASLQKITNDKFKRYPHSTSLEAVRSMSVAHQVDASTWK